jgi:hypothetical protein
MFVFIFILNILSCSNDCNVDFGIYYFTDKWWQVHYNGHGISNCYLFKEDGIVVEDNGDHKWPSTKWAVVDETCEIEIVTKDEKEITLKAFNGVCWVADVDDRENLTVCECLY